jgi:hypothetical protein
MNIDDIKIKIKTYDKQKNHVIANLVIRDTWEIRGYILRYTTTKYSPINPVWVVTPPSVKGRGKMYFHIVRCLDSALWQQVQARLIDLANEHANSL